MTRLMRDSTTAADIPADSEMVLGYVDGAYAWSAADLERFAHAVRVRCSVNAFGNVADVLDVETGDASATQGPGWVGRMHALGVARPTLYCNRGNEGAIDQALHDAGVPVDSCGIIVATLDGEVVTGTTAHGYPIVACQDKGSAQTGGRYDESIVYDDDWPYAAPQPASPTTPEDDPMVLLQRKDGGQQFLVTGAGVFYVPDLDTWNALRDAGVRDVVVSDAFADAVASKCVNPPGA